MTESIVVTSSDTIEQYTIDEYVGFTSVDFQVRPKVMKTLLNSLSEGAGKRGANLTTDLDVAREKCVSLLKEKAMVSGANGVVGLSMNVVGVKRLIVIVTGTMVKCRKIEAERELSSESQNTLIPVSQTNHIDDSSAILHPESQDQTESAGGLQDRMAAFSKRRTEEEPVITLQTDSSAQQRAVAASALVAVDGSPQQSDPSL